MRDVADYESRPTHPLGSRETWPVTGPIYGLPEIDLVPQPSRTMWQRLRSNVLQTTEHMAALPGNSPIWY